MGRVKTPTGPRSVIVGANIRARRERLGITQKELADRLGWSQQIVPKLELAQTNMRVEQLLDIADALGCSAGTLLRGAS